MRVIIYLAFSGKGEIVIDWKFLFYPLLLAFSIWILGIITGKLQEEVKRELAAKSADNTLP